MLQLVYKAGLWPCLSVPDVVSVFFFVKLKMFQDAVQQWGSRGPLLTMMESLASHGVSSAVNYCCSHQDLTHSLSQGGWEESP